MINCIVLPTFFLIFVIHTIKIPSLYKCKIQKCTRRQSIVFFSSFRVVLPLPNTIQPDGERIILVRPGAYDPKNVKFEQIIQLGSMLNDVLNIEDDNFGISGLIVVVDFANVTPSHLAQMKPSVLSKIFTLLQDASLVRFHAIHLINTPPTFETVYTMAIRMLSEKNQASFAAKLLVCRY
jgi:CRAL/TRIO domain